MRKVVEGVVKLSSCDVCGLSFEGEFIPIEEQEAFSYSWWGGYGSVFGDGGKFEVDICQCCFQSVFGEFVREVG